MQRSQGLDMKLLSHCLFFYTNISANGHDFNCKILKETKLTQLLQNILSSNIISTGNEEINSCLARLIELFAKEAEKLVEVDQDLLQVIIGIAKALIIQSK